MTSRFWNGFCRRSERPGFPGRRGQCAQSGMSARSAAAQALERRKNGSMLMLSDFYLKLCELHWQYVNTCCSQHSESFILLLDIQTHGDFNTSNHYVERAPAHRLNVARRAAFTTTSISKDSTLHLDTRLSMMGNAVNATSAGRGRTILPKLHKVGSPIVLLSVI